MINNKTILNLDWPLIGLYVSLVAVSCTDLYMPSQVIGANSLGLSSSNIGSQVLWIFSILVPSSLTLFFSTRLYRSLAYGLYTLSLLLLVLLLTSGVSLQGSIYFQAVELTKLSCILALSSYLGLTDNKLSYWKTQLVTCCILIFPAILITLWGDIGSALLFGILALSLYREGLPKISMLKGLLVFAVVLFSFFINYIYLAIGVLCLGLLAVGIGKRTQKSLASVALSCLVSFSILTGARLTMIQALKKHSENSFSTLASPNKNMSQWDSREIDQPRGVKFWNKDLLEEIKSKSKAAVPGTKFPGLYAFSETHSWAKSLIFISIFMTIVLRIFYVAERQRLKFARIYGYGVGTMFLSYLAMNIGMAVGKMPSIAIPFPFIGSGTYLMYSLSVMLFVLLRLDSDRKLYASQ